MGIQSIVLICHVLAACGLIALVLLQHGRGADAGAAFGSGSSGTMFGPRGAASFLTKITAFLAATFFITSLSLSFIAGQSAERKSLMERVGTEQVPTPADEIPVSTEIPAARETDLPDMPSSPSAGTDVPAAPGPGQEVPQ